ncbi:MAG: hypothetical protein ACC653_04235 [Gammaproteobacteria bacterium]
MPKLSRLIIVVAIIAPIAFPAHAKSRHEMCEIAEMASEVISQKIGDSAEITAQKRNTVHNQCFTAPISEIEAAYSYLIENWDSIFDHNP